MPIDVAELRATTPGCASVAHLNNAGSALPSQATLDATVAHLQLEARIGGYEAADAAADALRATRTNAARLLNADPSEIAITTSDTVSFAKALWGYAFAGGLPAGGRVLVDRLSYNSHYFAVHQAARRYDLQVDVVPSLPDGTIDLDAFDRLLDDRVFLVSATHVGTHRGLVNPVEEIGARCQAAHVHLFLDACQSVGQLPVDVDAIGCTVLTATGRKWLRGPRGTGLLYVKAGFLNQLDPPGIDSHSATWQGDSYVLNPDASRFEEFETSIAAQVGLGVALGELLVLGVDAVSERVIALAEGLRAQLADVRGVQVLDGGTHRSGIVTFTVAGRDAADVKAAATAAGVNVSVSTDVGALLDMRAEGRTAVVRASPHVYNDETELARLLDVVRAAGG